MADSLKFDSLLKSPNQFVDVFGAGIKLYIKREDLLHPEVSGNKFRKLKYNLKAALQEGYEQILTFGGAFSNHITATAAAGKLMGIKTIGVIRGEELGENLEQTLASNRSLNFAHSCGMELCFISRSEYRQKEDTGFIEALRKKFGEFFLIPEGGTNKLAIAGCEEILTQTDKDFEYVCCAVGTGGTISGIINSAAEHQKILGFPALKGDFLSKEIKKNVTAINWELILNYHFGGYAKVNKELVDFINGFKQHYNIQLGPIYTGKLLFGIFDLLKKNYFAENSRILVIHTGGQQGIAGINQRLYNKKQQLINT